LRGWRSDFVVPIHQTLVCLGTSEFPSINHLPNLNQSPRHTSRRCS
jgi:hypothetical protein